MRPLILGSALGCLTLFGCTDFGKNGARRSELTTDGYTGPVLAPSQIPATGPLPAGCVRAAIGDLGKNITLTIDGTRTITFTGWTTKTGKNDQYVRFSFEASGPVAYTVKAGTEIFSDTVLLWAHPGGLSGPSVKGISDITFCAAPPGTGGAAPAPTQPASPTPTIQSTGSTTDGYGGAACTANLQCWSGECLNNVCSKGWSFDRCLDGARDCISGECTQLGCAPIPNGERGAPCLNSLQCWSGACVLSICQGGDLNDACRSIDDCKIGYGCKAGTCQVGGFAN